MEMARSINPKKIWAKDRLILALDLEFAEAKELMDKIGDKVSIIKINFLRFVDLFHNEDSKNFINDLMRQGKDFFLDFKFDDIPNTVQEYVHSISKIRNIKFFTIHGNSKMMEAAMSGKNGNSGLKILIVTVLTSLDEHDLKDIFSSDAKISMEKVVKDRVERALHYKVDGVIASGRDVKWIKEIAGDQLTIVTPGIRLDYESNNDHKRPATPEQAIMEGADYLVVGRPIYTSNDPAKTIDIFLERMQAAFDEKYNQ